MSIKGPTYSDIIEPSIYERLMTDQHLYIAASDRAVKRAIEKHLAERTRRRVLEIGCGPGRLTSSIATISDIDLKAFDHDPKFIEYARAKASRESLQVIFNEGAAATFTDDRKPLDVCYSQGMHHHIEKGASTHAYLTNVREHLDDDGIFVLSDEFLPEYSDAPGRRLRTVVWHAHIIAHALEKEFTLLAQEEAKTLLDDLGDDGDTGNIKNRAQIDLVLERVGAINRAAWGNHKLRRNMLVTKFFEDLKSLRNTEQSGDKSIDVSRGDYKICERVFKKEVEGAGFKVRNKDVFGQIKLGRNIGGLVVYTLVKS